MRGTSIADSYDYKERLAALRDKVKVGDRLTLKERKCKVVAVYKRYFVVEYTIYHPMWGNRSEVYRETFFWDELLQ